LLNDTGEAHLLIVLVAPAKYKLAKRCCYHFFADFRSSKKPKPNPDQAWLKPGCTQAEIRPARRDLGQI
jgi:hypothetical protein